MKKIVIFLLIISASTPVFAQDKPTLVFDKRDGKVIAVGYFTPENTTPFEGVEYLKSEIPKERLEFFTRTAPGIISEKSQADKDAITAKEKAATDTEFMTAYNKLNTEQAKQAFIVKILSKLSRNLKLSELEGN